MPSEVLLNGYHFMDDTTDFIKEGTTETWQWINLTVDAHPMHPHLVASQVVNRQEIDVEGIRRIGKPIWPLTGLCPALKPNR